VQLPLSQVVDVGARAGGARNVVDDLLTFGLGLGGSAGEEVRVLALHLVQRPRP
jgi:hypothetical protein